MRNAKVFLTHENKICFKPQGAMYLFSIWNLSGLFLSKLFEGNKKYSFLLKNSKRNTVVHSKAMNDMKSLIFFFFIPALCCNMLKLGFFNNNKNQSLFKICSNLSITSFTSSVLQLMHAGSVHH